MDSKYVRILTANIIVSFLICDVFSNDDAIPVGVCKNCNCYRKFSADHTSCKDVDRRRCGRKTSSCLTEDDKTLILNLHNYYRSKVAMGSTRYGDDQPKVANMMRLYWDEELAKVAQSHADQCRFNHDCHGCRQDPRFSVGQNLCMVNGNGRQRLDKCFKRKARNIFFNEIKDECTNVIQWKFCTSLWYNEIEYFKPKWSQRFRYEFQTGHFTQMLWSNTWKIGCGCRIFDGDVQILTCNYGPRGNVIDKQMYVEGEPCSSCPRNTCCNCNRLRFAGKYQEYSGLCEPIDEFGPLQPLPRVDQDTVMWCNFSSATVHDCQYELSHGSVRWTTGRTYTRIYQSVILRRGQQTDMRFLKKMAVRNNRIEIRFSIRMATGSSRFLAVSPLTVRFKVGNRNVMATQVSFSQRKQFNWIPVTVKINGRMREAQMVLEIKNVNSRSLRLDVADIMIRKF